MKSLLLPLAGGFALTAIASAQVTISEVRIDQPSADADEYFELAGPAGTDLTGYTYLVIGDASGAGTGGGIEAVVDLTGQTIPASGYFVVAEDTFTIGTADLAMPSNFLNFENSDNVTHMLVQGFTGANGDDLDTNDDNTLDVTPWTTLVDSIALVEDPVGGELFYGANTIGPDGTFVPGHVYVCSGVWNIGDFAAGVNDTPGAVNCGASPITTFCDPANVNSSGLPVSISGAFGTGVESDLHIDASGGPSGEFGYFLIGTAPETMAPLTVSNGLLCLSTTAGNSFGRYNLPGTLNSLGSFDGAGDFTNLGGTSTTGMGYDVASTVPLTGFTTIMAGDTWHFQMWYRDGASGAGNSNLSNGLTVNF